MSYTLVVDDDHESCRMLAVALRAIGIEARAAYNAQDAFQQIKDELPELIILDLMLPGMNGFEMFKQLRGEPLTMTLPIIVLSAHINEQTHFEFPGVEHFLLKGSYRIPELRELVAEAIGQRGV